MLVRLLYASRATEPVTPQAIDTILAQSRAQLDPPAGIERAEIVGPREERRRGLLRLRRNPTAQLISNRTSFPLMSVLTVLDVTEPGKRFLRWAARCFIRMPTAHYRRVLTPRRASPVLLVTR